MYDIVVAEVESVKGKSLHELQDDLDSQFPDIKHYFDLSTLLLSTSALLQKKLPSKRGMLLMDKSQMVDNWEKMQEGLNRMAKFLTGEGIYDRQRLPTNAVLAVIAALFTDIPDEGDERGQAEVLLKRYLWSSFFTDRYENSAATHAFSDFMNLKRVILKQKKENGEDYTEADVLVLNREEYPLAEKEELVSVGWPKQENIRGRGILAVASRLGAQDFATGEKMARENLSQREYHHIFPDALLKEAKIDSFLALNCALISGKTNRKISRKDPLQYLKERYEWITEEIVDERLNSHLIPIAELANGGYESLREAEKNEKLKNDFQTFIKRRAELICKAVPSLVEGRSISISAVLSE